MRLMITDAEIIAQKKKIMDAENALFDVTLAGTLTLPQHYIDKEGL